MSILSTIVLAIGILAYWLGCRWMKQSSERLREANAELEKALRFYTWGEQILDDLRAAGPLKCIECGERNARVSETVQ